MNICVFCYALVLIFGGVKLIKDWMWIVARMVKYRESVAPGLKGCFIGVFIDAIFVANV